MQLNYRGTTYSYAPPTLEVQEDQLTGQYRGLAWTRCNPAKSYVHPPQAGLVYRGACPYS
jgi:hypothetical protein